MNEVGPCVKEATGGILAVSHPYSLAKRQEEDKISIVLRSLSRLDLSSPLKTQGGKEPIFKRTEKAGSRLGPTDPLRIRTVMG